jgi:hypothetical protein
VVFGSGGHDFLPNGPVLRALAADPAVTGVTNLRIDAASSGKIPVLAHSYDPVGAPVPLVLTAGVLQPATTNWCWRPPPPGGSAPASDRSCR